MIRAILVFVASILLASCMQDDVVARAPTDLSDDKILAITTVEGFVQAGAVRLSGEEFKKEIVGHTLREVRGIWTWSINKNGTSNWRLSDGDGGSDEWQLKGNEYCRDVPLQCSHAYRLAGVYRFSEGAEGALAPWAARVISK